MQQEEKNEEKNKNGKIPTRVLPGFMELLPGDQIAFDRVKEIIKSTYEEFGFMPIDTPVIEREEVLLAKAGGETERQIYSFMKGDNNLALRFDLTVPLARYVSEHVNELTFPFRRYQIAKVYRGESPQKGRFREFYQCDIDIVGNGSLSIINDAEIPSVVYSVFKKLDFGPFVIKINNRKLVTGLLASLGAGPMAAEVMRAIDKLEKVGESGVMEAFASLGISGEISSQIFKFLNIKGKTNEISEALKNFGVENAVFSQGIMELSEVINYLGNLGVPEEFYKIDLSIARGLDYYTGTVYETVLVNYPQIGSVCSGGRYDNLAEKYTDKKLPGVGISIGLTRLFSQLKEAGLIQSASLTPTKVLVVPLAPDMSVSLNIASTLRGKGIPTEVYLEDVKMKNKLAYADKLGIPYVILVGEDEIKSGNYTLKNMTTGDQIQAPIDQLVSKINL